MFFGRRVSANVDIVGALCDHPTINFVDDVVDIFEIVGIGDDFIAGDNVL